MTSPRLGDRSPATADTPPANAGVPAAGPPNAAARPGRVSRRGLLGAAGAGLAGVAAGAAGGFALAKQDAEVAAVAPGARSYPFYGTHQAGIVTPVQDRLHFAAFDVTSGSRDELVSLLENWTAAAARMTRGLGAGQFGPTSGPYGAPPDDTGEAIGLPPAGLTITFGFGPSLFSSAGQGPVRHRRAPTCGARATAALPGRQSRPGQVRR